MSEPVTKPGRKAHLHNKRCTPFVLPLEMADAVDEMRGTIPRNTWLRDVLKAFLASGEKLPRYEMPHDGPKSRIYFEMSEELSGEIQERMEALKIGRFGTFHRLAIVWHLKRTTAQVAAAREYERLVASGALASSRATTAP